MISRTNEPTAGALSLGDLSPVLREALRRRLRERVAGESGPGVATSDGPAAAGAADGLPLSFAQQRLWFLDQVEGERTAYNLSSAWRLRGMLDGEALRRAFETVVARHEPLRTVFLARDGVPRQVVRPPGRFDLPVRDLRELPENAREREVTRIAMEEADRPFDLARDLMMRATLLRLSDTEQVLLLTQHHIATDGWSQRVLWRETQALYEAFRKGEPAALPALPLRYADHAAGQRERLRGESRERQLRFWRGKLADLAPLELPTDRPHGERFGCAGGEHRFRLEADLVARLRALGLESGATLQMVLLGAFQALLSRHSGQADVAVAVPIAGRTSSDLEPLIGFFVNTLVLRVNLSGAPNFRGLVQRVRETSLGAYDHQELPFEMLVEELQPERLPGRTPLAQVFFQLMRFGEGGLALAGIEAERLPDASPRTRFDLEMHLWQEADAVRGSLVYRTDLFDAATIERMAGHYLKLLAGIAADPEAPVSDLPLLTEAELRELSRWSGGGSDPGAGLERCVHELVEEQVARTPDDVAVVMEARRLSYRELNDEANRLGRYLQSLGVERDTRVGIWAERSPETLVGVLAVLKAGGCYVPLDPELPAERLACIIGDSGMHLLLAPRKSMAEVPRHGVRVIAFDEATAAGTDAGRVTDADLREGRAPGGGALAYVLYTSGTTGRPKGVAMPHEPLVNLISWQNANSGAHRGTRTLQYASLSFDVSFQEIFSTWSSGGMLVLVTTDLRRDPEMLWRFLRAERIGRLFLPFVALQQIAEVAGASAREGDEAARELREIITAGEQLRVTAELRRFFEGLPGCTLSNHYGPTEAHVVTAHRLSGSPGDWPVLPPVGRPIANAVIRILDDRGRPVPAGVAGEVHIGGRCLARGYLGRPEMTCEKFIPDPSGNSGGDRLYRTGDRARWRADGEIEYLGRSDDQVKIRGHRVEPAEVESILAGHPEVSQCAVVAGDEERGGRRLIAYVVSRGRAGGASGARELRGYLRAKLPGYMVPSVFVPVEAIPLTVNGKVDRRALPPAEAAGGQGAEAMVAPRDELEWQLKSIWEAVLGVGAIGVTDSFFDLGGHSLLVVRLLGEIEKMLGVRVPLSSFFREPTVEAVAGAVRGERARAPREPGIIELQPGNGSRPVFWAPSVGDVERSVECLRISELLADARACYAFDAAAAHADIRSLADHCVRLIRGVQPRGPYALAGYCQGGHVAFEIACRLQAQGEEVELLALLGCSAMEFPRVTLRQKAGWVRDGFRGDTRNVFKRLSAAIGRRVAGRMAGGLRNGVPSFLEERFRPHAMAVRAHRTGYFRGPITLVHSAIKSRPLRTLENGWDVLAAAVHVHTVPGTHSDMMKEPSVREVAGILMKSLPGSARDSSLTAPASEARSSGTPRG